MNDLQKAQQLRGAADYLRVHGWTQGTFMGRGGSACIWGALFEVVPAATDRVTYIFDAFAPFFEGSLMGWNDKDGRTVDEVLDRLESAALGLEVRHLSHETQAPLEVVVTPERELVTQPFEV